MQIVTHDKVKCTVDSSLDSFLEFSPDHPNAAALSASRMAGRRYPRDELVRALIDYNKAIGNDDPQVLTNADKVKDENTYCVVTGQQLGLLGGPAYTILKAISCILLARDIGAVPIFWLATEDHDIGEIEKTFTLDALGNIKKYRLSFPKGGAVEDLTLSQKNIAVIESFFEENGIKKPSFAIHEGDSYAIVMARLLSSLFRGTGLLFIEPRCLRGLSTQFFVDEVTKAKDINAQLRRDTKELIDAGGTAPLNIAEGDINLFFKDDQKRRKRVLRHDKGFDVGGATLSEAELIALIQEHPERFSPSAVARPLLQCSVIPTVAYIAGPTELEYHRQLKGYFTLHELPMPWLYPRLSVTFLTKEAERILERLGLQPWYQSTKSWEEIFPELNEIKDAKKRKKETQALCKGKDIAMSSLHYLNNLQLPYGQCQERTLNWMWLQGQSDEDLVQGIMQHLSWNSQGHHILMRNNGIK